MPEPSLLAYSMGLKARKSVFRVCKQQRRRLISAFVICFSEQISKVATSEISILELVSVAGETGLRLALSETLKTACVVLRPVWK